MDNEKFKLLSQQINVLMAMTIKNESYLTTLLDLQAKQISENKNIDFDIARKEITDLILINQNNAAKEAKKLFSELSPAFNEFAKNADAKKN